MSGPLEELEDQMADPLSTAITAIIPKTLDLMKNRRLYDHIVGGALFFLLLSFFSLNIGQPNQQFVTSPPAIAAHVLRLLGLTDVHQIDDFAVWASRPVFAPVLQLGAVAAGIALLWRSSSGAFTAWLLLLFAASGIGWVLTLQSALWSFGIGFVIITIASIINTGPTADDRQWRTPEFTILDTTLGTLVLIIAAPINPIIETARALRRQHTYERAQEPAQRTSPSSFRRTELPSAIGGRLPPPG